MRDVRLVGLMKMARDGMGKGEGIWLIVPGGMISGRFPTQAEAREKLAEAKGFLQFIETLDQVLSDSPDDEKCSPMKCFSWWIRR